MNVTMLSHIWNCSRLL